MPYVRSDVPGVESLDHEVKFVLAASLAGPARALLEGVCRREHHARSRIGTIYFDDRALGSAHEKWASDYRKTKVRLRWYDGAGTVHLEVKRRVGSRREKLRFETSMPGEQLESGGLHAAAAAGVGGLLAGLGIESPADLAPALRLVYSRDRFVDSGSGSRLSLDSAIAAVERAPWCAATGLPAGARGELDVALVECKGASRDLPATVAALAALGVRRSSFSKYNACLTHGTYV
jgi:hypothetical protein